MRVLVSGGAGFIGSHIVSGALAEGHEVVVLDDLSTGKRENVPAGARLYVIDLRDAAAVRACVADFRPELVSHQAAQASVAVSMREPRRDLEINLFGGLSLLEACLATGVRRFVFASTGGALYGEVAEGRAASEDTRAAPESPYAVSKLGFEQLLAIQQRRQALESVVLRYANVYGPRQDPHGEAGVVAIFFDRALRGETLSVNARKRVGDSGCVRDYVYVGDVARANLLALFSNLPERVLNVASGVPTTTRALAESIARLCGVAPKLTFAAPRAGDIGYSLLDTTRARPVLGAPLSLAEGLERTYDWYRSRT